MNKLLLLLALSFFSAQSLAAGCPDGSEPVKSISDDGSYFVFNCGGSNTANSSTSSQKVAKALAGIDIENDPNINFFAPPSHPPPTRVIYSATGLYFKADFNNDGLTDVIYTGVMHAKNLVFCMHLPTEEFVCKWILPDHLHKLGFPSYQAPAIRKSNLKRCRYSPCSAPHL